MNRRIGRSRTRIHSLSSSCSISRSGTEHGRQRPDKPSLSRAANPNRGRGRPISIVPRCAKTMLSMQRLCVRACMQYSYSYSTPTVQASHAGGKGETGSCKTRLFPPGGPVDCLRAQPLCALRSAAAPPLRLRSSIRSHVHVVSTLDLESCSGSLPPYTHTACRLTTTSDDTATPRTRSIVFFPSGVVRRDRWTAAGPRGRGRVRRQ
jgi:hypothetical protein